MSSRAHLILRVVATDRTFALAASRNGTCWLGKCIHCNAAVEVAESGQLRANVTLEHILPLSHGGNDDLQNLAIACARCNHQKGTRLDHLPKGDPRLMAVVEKLLARRHKRWRNERA